MKVVVLQGSNKLDNERATSTAYIDFFKANYKEHSFDVLPIGREIVKMEKDESLFNSIMEGIAQADLILWVVPVFSALVPSGVKRFVELISEKGKEDVFKDKYVGGLFTSANVLDDCAISYIRAISEDLSCRYIDTYSAVIYPVINEQYKKNMCYFMDNLLEVSKNALPVLKEFRPIESNGFVYNPGDIVTVKKSSDKKIIVIADISEDNSNIAKMVDTYIKYSPYEVEIFNLNDSNYSHCNGCLKCSQDFNCGFKDGFKEALDERVLTADAVIVAGKIKDRYLSSKIKIYFDREFTYNHTQIHKGRLFGFLISGPLSGDSNIRKALNGIVELRAGSTIDFVSDEIEDSESLTAIIKRLSERVTEGIEKRVFKPLTFSGVGAQRILRDLVYVARFPFKADFLDYKKNLFKSLPQKRKKIILKSTLLGLLAKIKGDEAVIDMYKSARISKIREQLLPEEQIKK